MPDDPSAPRFGLPRIGESSHWAVVEHSGNIPASDLDGLRRAFARLDREVDEDPAAAAVEASDLLRATLRAILSERGIDHGAGEGIDTLSAKVIPVLGQVAGAVPDAMRGAGHMRALLTFLARAPEELARLAPLYDGARGLKPRHARFGIGAAAAVAVYLASSHLEIPPRKAPAAAQRAA